MRFFPDTLFAFEGGRDDQLPMFRDIAMDTQCLEVPMMLDKCEGDHRVELGDEGLADREIFGEGKIEEDQLFATFLVEVVDEVEDALFLKCLDCAVEPVFGDLESFFGGAVELVNRKMVGLIGGQNGEEGDLLSVETTLKKALELCCALMRGARHQRQGAELEKAIETAAL